jgi:CHAT domain-containing protein
LSYDLGEERSYLWAVTEERLETFVLPSGQDLEREARSTHYLLSHSRERASGLQVEIQVAKLGRLLLGPVADQIKEYPRIVVSVEGDLHLIPFGALPDPGSDGALLLTRHEIAYAPSASVLVWLGERQDRAGSQASGRTLAVVADPVFGPDDDRLRRTRGADLATGAGRTPPVLAGPDLRRLPYSEREADAVLALVPAKDRSSARSFAARKELLTEGGLSDYRILHFATHGWFSPEHPELSALVLSRLDEAGRPRDGVVWAHEIAALDLRADLVVLSACETGLGAPIHGDGLVGLSDAFFRAGVPRVLVSLWRVDDQAAVELMTGFYQGFLHQGLTASEALGRAQLAVRADPRWQRPYFWAGFVLQGQW